MKTIKMSLANMQERMSRKEMKEIMAGSGGGGGSTVSTWCKNDNNVNLGEIQYDCSSQVTRIQACKDAGHSGTTQTAGAACP